MVLVGKDRGRRAGRIAAAQSVALAAIVLGMMAGWRVGRAQDAGSKPSAVPCTSASQATGQGSKALPCAASAEPSAAQKFPFPDEDPAATPAQPAKDTAVPDAPVDGAALPAKPSGSAAFPFPEEEAKPSAAATSGSANAGSAGIGAGSSGSSSSSSSGGDTTLPPDLDADPDAKPKLKDEGSHGRRILPRVNPKGTKLQTDDEREAEDLDIAHYYIQSGNLQGAYLRSQDAVKTDPSNPDAHFALAEIARRLNKKDEAIAEYNACLKLDPDEKKASAARKELEKLKP